MLSDLPLFFREHATAVLIEVELNPGKQIEFNRAYQDATGEKVERGPHCQLQPNKWGIECRVYFRGDNELIERLRDLGFSPDSAHRHPDRFRGYRSKYDHRVNSYEVAFALFRGGYRIGGQDPHKQQKLF